MKTLELWLLEYLLNSLWQITVVFLAALLAARLVRKAGPRIEHRIWVAALVVETILPACRFRTVDIGAIVRRFMFARSDGKGGEASIVVSPAQTIQSGLHLPQLVMTMLLITYFAVLLYFSLRLAWGLWKAGTLARHSEPVVLNRESTDALSRSILAMTPAGVSLPVEIATSPMISVPITIGIRRHLLLLPQVFLESVSPADLDALLAHEFAHISRRDFVKNVFYGVLALPISFHPLARVTRARLAETRELVCDAMAAEVLGGRGSYARSLLRLASVLSRTRRAIPAQALAIFDTNNLERRIMNLKQKPIRMGATRRLAVVSACIAIAVAACTSALALRMEVTADTTQKTQTTKVKVDAKELKIVHKEPPTYPVQAKTSGDTLNGTVQLDVVVGKTGDVENIRVKKSLRDDYDQAAIDAVRKWRWEPYHVNGAPIEVLTTINITYSLAKK
ncbi:MAG TPA: M56 family metallopeptidase [Terracidiphilus sp.]|jgi:TonB family protein|nr:M56 family metallopeptidase [Terracidiphilus sp.]